MTTPTIQYLLLLTQLHHLGHCFMRALQLQPYDIDNMCTLQVKLMHCN